MEDNSLDMIFAKLDSLDKGNRKTLVMLELIKDYIDKSSAKEDELKHENAILKEENLMIINKVINLLDYFDNIYDYAQKSNNLTLQSSLQNTLKMIKNDLMEIGLEEVPGVGALFNNKLHECIQVREDDGKMQYEILDVVKKGYIFNGKTVRPAKVIAEK